MLAVGKSGRAMPKPREAWAQGHREYWRKYRRAHPKYCESNLDAARHRRSPAARGEVSKDGRVSDCYPRIAGAAPTGSRHPQRVAAAVLVVLARTQSRPFAAIEEALLVRELVQSLGLSQHEVAHRCGRDVWRRASSSA
jgi:hypothetical protein